MASVQLTDEELFSELKRLGASPGPVTENTRPVYLKRLKKLREEQQQRSRGVKGRNGSSVNSSSSASASGGGSGSNNGHTAAGASAFRARPAASDVTHVNSTRSSGSRSSLNEKRGDRSGKFVLGFSSDESDAEAPQKRGGLSPSSGGRRDRGSALHSARPTQESPAVGARRTTGLGLNSSGKSHLGLPESRRSTFGSALLADYRGNLSFGDSHKIDRHDGESEETDHLQEEPGSTGRTLNGSKGTYSNQGDYSDSDEEEDDDEEEERRRRLLSRRSVTKFTSTPYKSVREKLTDHGSGAVGLDMASAQGEDDELIGSFLKTSRYTSVNGEEESRSGREAAASSGSLSSGLRARYSTYNSLASPYTFNHSNHTGSNHNYSHKRKATGPEDELLEQFKRDEVSGPGGFSAHYLSMFLLTAACLFFLLLGLMYLRMRGSGASDAVPGRSHPFGEDFDKTYNHAEKDTILGLLVHLHDHLANIAGEHDCKDPTEPLNRSISFSEATKYLMMQNKSYEGWIETAMEWIIRAGDICGIRLIADDPMQQVEDVSDVTRLESTHPRMSFICRFRRAFFTVIYRVLLILAEIGIVFGVLRYVKYRWRREEEETRQMYDMVERIIDVMRSHNEACQENKDLQPYLPIPHVRDSLVSPHDRKKMKKVWDRAVTFLSETESRIRTETQRIGGADFMVWRWLQPPLSCDKMSSMPSKMWQGKAFPLDRRNSPPNSLTPCLKIRNMFDPVMEVGENWHLAIQEAILEKCSDNDGIVHIAVDKNSREGCVYVKCLSAEHSGKAFKALHGSWFDGKLVTVKYLRLDRYHQRFPQALGCNTPLKPSSSSMNTMARLQPSSSPSSFLSFS